MKKILFIVLLLAVAACADDDERTGNTLVLTNDFEIIDDPNDSVQHERYLIYKEYNTPVFFLDTIAVKPAGTDWYGNAIYKYETIDLNWTFSGYNRNVSYKYRYLNRPEDQMNALRFTRKYLQAASKPMRPFSIFLVDTLSIVTTQKTEKPMYHVGFRTLVFAQIKDLTDPDTITTTITAVIKNMIADRVASNREVCDRFATICNEKGYYYQEWSELGNCPTITKWLSKSWMFTPNALWSEPPYTTYDNEDLIDLLTRHRDYSTGQPYVSSVEEAEDIRQKMLTEMGNYGFIRAWKSGGQRTPANATEDRSYFIQAILHLGDRGFRERYGASKLVMQKYEILYNFIRNDLEVTL